MRLSDFNYELPSKLIATHPLAPRDAAKLMVINRSSGELTHSHFYDLAEYLRQGDFLVFNQSRVIPARLFGKTADKDVEILLIKQKGDNWEAIAKPGKRLGVGSLITFDELKAKVVGKKEGTFELLFNIQGDKFWAVVDNIGEMPLPPYILKERHERHEESVDRGDYQTIYAKEKGSVAAPTAGLHFTDKLMQKIEDKGCEIDFVTLHVGLGTFEPIRTKNVEDHKIHSEYFELSGDLAEKLNKAKKEGRRIIAVGTTTVRVLESCTENGSVKGKKGETDIYIYPGYKFQSVDGLITNFHLPRSSLLLLVSAFWDRRAVLQAYNKAVNAGYRFYSYGDGMFIS